MRLMLVGADCEENLGMCMISAGAAARGHTVQVVPFDHAAQTDAVVRCILERDPGCVGLATQFQHRGFEFLTVATRLRRGGYRGHITCGGQFPSMAWREVLEGSFGVDSVVIHEGDHTIGELLDTVQNGNSLERVAGLAYVGDDGKAVRTGDRPLIPDLDALPIARRYRGHSRHFGVPFIPVWGSRGCWGSCTYCSISSGYRDARAHGGGRTMRLRSPQNIATEMAVLWHAAGGAGIFCFHDENFLLPRPADTLARVTEIRHWLDEYGVGKAALVGKCRPESLTAELATQLRALGMIRLYVGVENASQRCSDHLNRRTRTETLRSALEACRIGGIFPCYNLLLFEPGATIGDIEENVAFIRRHPTVPVNFCRAEPYHGTPLYEQLHAAGALGGSFLGWDYRLTDDRTELLFRICSAVFRERNFDARGVTNRSMGLGYASRVLEFFHEDRAGSSAGLMRRASELTTAMNREKCDLLDEAIALAKHADLGDVDRIERETAMLGLRIAAGNSGWHKALDEIIAEMNAFAQSRGEGRVVVSRTKRTPNRSLVQAMQAVAVVSGLSVAAPACGARSGLTTPPVDAGPDVVAADIIGPYDALPYDSGIDVTDPPPPDAGRDVYQQEIGPYDALPYDSGTDDEPNVPDFLPQDAALDLDRIDDGQGGEHPARNAAPATLTADGTQPIERWRDTSPRRAMRTTDLPFHQPPTIALSARREGGRIRVTIEGSNDPMGTRWLADGDVVGDGTSVEWVPASDDGLIRVAVRTRGGVAIASLRVADVRG